MSKNHIKIFDDTVLKLSINQGTENQRTANSIGRFTSGELAFTRDTGRVFIGNYSDKEYNSSIMLPETHGGILTGNKYLGYIDSKPLSWWRNVEYVSGTHLNYDEETKFNEGTKDSYTKESSMLGKDSKFRNRKAKDGNTYNGKWERDAIYNEKYDAYNGDYIYDMYENALILFDTNISNKTLPVIGTERYEDDENYSNREQFFDDSNNPLPIDEQYRRTRLENYDVDDVPKVYGDGYVIFRNVEPDGVTIKFKEKKFEDNGSTIKDGSPAHNYSHNILTVGSVGTEAISNAFNPDHFNSDLFVSLNSELTEIKSILNEANTFSLPQNLTLRKIVEGDTSAITLNFSETTNNVGTMDESSLTFVLSKDDNTNNYKVGIAKPSVSEFYIKLGDGLKNTGTGDPSYLKLNSMTAGDLTVSTPTISLSASSENFTNIDNKILSNPFNTICSSSPSGVYVGNLHISENGLVDIIEDYEDSYKKLISENLNKFETNKNISINHLKKPVTILWNQDGTGYDENEDIVFDVQAEFLIKPYFFCTTKSVYVNGIKAEDAEHDNSVYVLGNNHYASSSEKGDYMVIPGYNVPVDINIRSVADIIKRQIGLKPNREEYRSGNTKRISKSLSGIFSSSLKNLEKDGYIFDATSNTHTLHNKNIFDEAETDENGPYFMDNTIYDDIIHDVNVDISPKNLFVEDSTFIEKYYNYENIHENTQSLLDLCIYLDTKEITDKNGNIISYEMELRECEELLRRNKRRLNDGDDIQNVSMVTGTILENRNGLEVENIFSVDLNEIKDKLGLTVSSEGEISSTVLTKDNNYTYVDKTANYNTNYVITTNPNDKFSVLIVSFYSNGYEMMLTENMPTILRIDVENKYGEKETRDINITDKIIPNNYINFYKKTSTDYVSKSNVSKMAEYYTTSVEDSLDGSIPKFIAFIQVKYNNGNYEKFKIDDFISEYDSYIEIINDNFLTTYVIKSEIFNNIFEETVDENTITNYKIDEITFVKVEQHRITTIEGATYFVNGVDISIDEGGNKVDLPKDLYYIEYSIDTHMAATIFWSKKGIHSPLIYKDTTLYIPGEPDSDTTTLNGKLNCEKIESVVLDESLSSADFRHVVIPAHASEAIFEVTHITNTSSPIGIFTSTSSLKYASKTIDVTNEDDTTETITLDTVRKLDVPSTDMSYTSSNGVYTINYPSYEENYTATSKYNLMIPNENEKRLLYSDKSSSHIMRVPLHQTYYDSAKGFKLRISGLKPSSTEKVHIRLIGYIA